MCCNNDGCVKMKSSILWHSMRNDNDGDNQELQQQKQTQNEYRSIGEVVGGLHGGKYQFGNPGVINGDAFSGYGGGGQEEEW